MEDQQFDRQLKNFFKRTGLLDPSPDFTQKVMGRIHQLPVEIAQAGKISEGTKDWVLFLAMGVVGVLATVWYFLSYNNIFSDIPKPEYWPLFEKITDSLSGIFSSFRVSSITVSVIAAIILVFAADFAIKKLQSIRKNYLFL
jgi:hypothetical protein